MKHIIVATLLIAVITIGIAYVGLMFAIPVAIFAAIIIPALVPAKTSKK